jgi:hypothetical protein
MTTTILVLGWLFAIAMWRARKSVGCGYLACCSPPPPPEPPDLGKATREGVSANLDAIPIQRLIDFASRAGIKAEYKDPFTGEMKTADFTGKGDADLSRLQAQTYGDTADIMARTLRDLGRKYNADFIDLAVEGAKRSDPLGYEARQELGRRLLADTGALPEESALVRMGRTAALERALDEFALGRNASADQLRNWQQDARAAAVARGNTSGTGVENAEAFNSFVNRDMLQQQRTNNLLAAGAQAFGQEQGLRQEKLQNLQRVTSNLSNYALATPISAQFQSLQGAQQGATPYQPVYVGGIGPNPNAGLAGAQWAGNLYGNQVQAYGIQSANDRYYSPTAIGLRVTEGIGNLGQAAKGFSSAGAACWVARAAFGEDNPAWLLFYEWKERVAPRSFRIAYNVLGRFVAPFVKRIPALRRQVRRWMQAKIEEN